MRPILWILLLFALAVALTLTARFDAGYVLIVLPPWRLEMSFVLAAVAMLALFWAFWFIWRLVNLAIRLPADVRAWHTRRLSDKAEDEFFRALAAYLSGQPAHAYTLAASACKRQRHPLTALLAAHAALASGDLDSARLWLDGLRDEDERSQVGELIAARQAVESRLAERAVNLIGD